MPAPVRARVAILTCSVVAIAGIGGWYGADLKISQQARKVSLRILLLGRQSRDLQKWKLIAIAYRRHIRSRAPLGKRCSFNWRIRETS